MKIAIIIPAYNEEDRIGKTLESYSYFFDQQPIKYKIIVVINNTTDRTEDIVKQHMKNSNITYLNLPKGGKGYAVMEGFKDALKGDFDLIGFVDADMATIPEAFHDLIINIKSADGAIANRYHKKSDITPKYNFRRLFIGKSFNFLVRSLLMIPTRDTQCGAKLFSNRAAKVLVDKVKMSQWAFDVEVLYHLNKSKLKIIELPTIWREIEGSKIDLKKASIQMFFSVIQLRLVNSPFNRLLNPLKKPIKLFWKMVQ